MTRLGLSVAIVSVGASILSAAQAPAPASVRARAATSGALRPQPAHTPSAQSGPTTFHAPATFKKMHCFECHGGAKHRGDVSIERLIKQSAESSVGDYWDLWDKVAEMLETKEMPPEDKADVFPTDDGA